MASIAVAWGGAHALNTINPATTLRVTRDSGLGAIAFSSIALDWTTLAFTLGIALVVGVLFGLLPALHATRASLAGAMKDAPAGSGSKGRRPAEASRTRRRGGRARDRAARRLGPDAAQPHQAARDRSRVRRAERADVSHEHSAGHVPRDSMPAFYAQLEQRLRAIPGVEDVALNNCAPLTGGCNGTLMRRLINPARSCRARRSEFIGCAVVVRDDARSVAGRAALRRDGSRGIAARDRDQ